MSTITVERGDMRDYRRLASLHYRAGAPACVDLVLRATCSHQTIAVLVVSRPVLNGSWRALAWPADYDRRHTTADRPADKRAQALHINADLRCISRIIVEPSRRGTGIATTLVRGYLASPLTPRTEALAAMGLASPIFLRAGMRLVGRVHSCRDERLIATLRAAGLQPFHLACPALALARAARHRAEIAAALRLWADAARGTRPLKHAPIELLMVRAAGIGEGVAAFCSG